MLFTYLIAVSHSPHIKNRNENFNHFPFILLETCLEVAFYGIILWTLKRLADPAAVILTFSHLQTLTGKANRLQRHPTLGVVLYMHHNAP